MLKFTGSGTVEGSEPLSFMPANRLTLADLRHRAVSYLRHLQVARSRYSLHSPFVFELSNRVFKPRMPAAVRGKIEAERRRLLKDRAYYDKTDFGAGSKVSRIRKRVCTETKYSAIGRREGRYLYNLCGFMKPSTVLELGTSAGIGTVYAAASGCRVVTAEGCPETQAIARRTANRLGYDNIEFVNCNLDDRLSALVETYRPGLIVFDANHTYAGLMRYFEACVPYATAESCFVIDDIYWSREMTAAWEAVKAHPAVHLTVDLFSTGYVFFRTAAPEQHFKLYGSF